MWKIRRLAVVVAVAAAVAFLVGLAGDHPLLRLLAKPVPVLAMAVAAATCRHAYGRLIAAGLVVCALGDVLLEVGEGTFLAGVGAFLVGHLFYTAAFVRQTRALRPWHALPFALWGVALLRFLWPGPVDPAMALPATGSTAAICTMLWRAAARWLPGSPAAPGVLAALTGALLFAASDSLIALNRFHLGGAHAAASAIRYWIIVLYWLGQTGIAASALRARR